MAQSLTRISARLAKALGMVKLEDWDAEPYVGGYKDAGRTIHIWRKVRFEEPKRPVCRIVISDVKKSELIRLVQIHPKRTDNGTAHQPKA